MLTSQDLWNANKRLCVSLTPFDQLHKIYKESVSNINWTKTCFKINHGFTW
jgi:hypothetical protein